MANLKFKDETGKWVSIPSIQGEPGEKGEPGAGIIPGGLAGQYLRKTTDADYETELADIEGESSIYFISDNTSSNPLILSQCKAGLYVFSSNTIYLKSTEDFK